LRKKYEEAVYQLFTDFREAYISVRRDVLYTIIIQFVIHVLTDFREAYISVRRDVLYTIIIQFVIHVKPVRLNKRV